MDGFLHEWLTFIQLTWNEESIRVIAVGQRYRLIRYVILSRLTFWLSPRQIADRFRQSLRLTHAGCDWIACASAQQRSAKHGNLLCRNLVRSNCNWYPSAIPWRSRVLTSLILMVTLFEALCSEKRTSNCLLGSPMWTAWQSVHLTSWIQSVCSFVVIGSRYFATVLFEQDTLILS